MKKLLTGTLCAAAMLIGTQAFAADATTTSTMSKDSMGKHDQMMKDCMTKEQASNSSMTHDQMMKSCMDKMKMKKDSMSKDSMMKKPTPATPPAN